MIHIILANIIFQHICFLIIYAVHFQILKTFNNKATT